MESKLEKKECYTYTLLKMTVGSHLMIGINSEEFANEIPELRQVRLFEMSHSFRHASSYLKKDGKGVWSVSYKKDPEILKRDGGHRFTKILTIKRLK